ncbi:DNA translocase FtsK [Alteromonas oceanisediminis]|uniref:DNA translocase FtsK n=1 Tax=Alteromonas oceanisediminis TaxID=2836180 RepID=UPI001BDB0B21|nr:DNA translocase FtsK 4TM domain-containing protein [Alteromonas oceanisediminis]MBT0586346.1 DNA translocase FtsK 4TM domain-containing protein [Alteromonas oceanisediminis]
MTRLTGVQRLFEVGMMLACTFSFFLLLAVATFHPADPGWSQVGLQTDIRNWVGATGAWAADILLFGFGYLAYAIPFACAFLGWFLFHHVKQLSELDYLAIGLRIIGTLLLALGLTGLASINFDDIYSFSAGGMVGDIISSALIPYFNTAGTILLLLCFFCTGFTLMTGLSWLGVIDGLGAGVLNGGRKLAALPQSIPALRLPQLKNGSEQAGNSTVNITSMRASPSSEETRKTPHFTIPEEVFSAQTEHSSSSNDVDTPAVSRLDTLKEKFAKRRHVDREHSEQKELVNQPAQSANTSTPPTQRPVEDLKDEVSVTAPPVTPMPSFDLLERADKHENPISAEELDAVSRLVEQKLADFNIEAVVVGVYPGPVITRFELDLAPGVKVSKITALSKDLARAMSAISVRVVEVIPGKSVIGLELPNKNREMVRLSEVISCEAFQSNASALTMVLGADISGKPVIVDLAKMPHLLVAGTTGSGKSVGVNVMILSLLYKSKPEDVRMIMIDPKMLELSVYEGIPHLLAEVVTDMKEAANALRWCVGEMERRYRLMSELGVRNLKGYNSKVLAAIEAGEPIKDPLWRSEESMLEEAPDLEKLPAIVVVVDEFADMMMIVGKKVEELIARIAQKARAAGIHLVLATQRPSVDVITGLIKANIPTRIAFQVSSKIDSRTILDQQGAEALLGAGDMLYLPPGTAVPTRVHGAFVDDHEVHAVVADWKARGEPEYIDEILNGEASADILLPGEQPEGGDQEMDAFYDEAVAFVTQSRKVSVSSVQRKFRIGYNRAARIVEQMELSGVVTASGHNGNREVLAPPPPPRD